MKQKDINIIPKIIHQIWSGVDEPLPQFFHILGETWKKQYPDWKYEFWDNGRMNHFVRTCYPHYWDAYQRYPYNVQRWDAIRYLILDHIGGMYVDFDYESLKPIDYLLVGKSCCFAMDSQFHCETGSRKVKFNNALMASAPAHPFMQKIIERVFSEKNVQHRDINKIVCVCKTTGQWNLVDLYEQATEEEKSCIYLIPDKYVTPLDLRQAKELRMGVENEELENCLKDAYAVHYYFNSWLIDDY